MALKLVELIIIFAIIIHSAEYISLHSFFSDSGIWRWGEIKNQNFFFKKISFLLSHKNFIALLYLRIFCAAAFLFFPFSVFIIFIFLTSLLISLRFRGSFNSGSESLSLIILGALVIASLNSGAKIQEGVLWYIALQLCNSYFMAGLVKLKQASWRNGSALTQFVYSANYHPPLFIKSYLANRNSALMLSWVIMLSEVSFPLIFLSQGIQTILWLSLFFTFHLLNVFIFGLNRFLIIWSAAYPAIYCVVNHLPSFR